jgi:hypothetical protein
MDPFVSQNFRTAEMCVAEHFLEETDVDVYPCKSSRCAGAIRKDRIGIVFFSLVLNLIKVEPPIHPSIHQSKYPKSYSHTVHLPPPPPKNPTYPRSLPASLIIINRRILSCYCTSFYSIPTYLREACKRILERSRGI